MTVGAGDNFAITTRRRFVGAFAFTGLSAALALPALTGCSATVEPIPPVPDVPTPDELLADATAAAAEQLATLYTRTIDAHADLSSMLLPLAMHHRAHRESLTPAVVTAPTSSAGATSSSGPNAPATATPDSAAISDSPTAALKALSAAEQAAADSSFDAVMAAEDPALARLLAGITACRASHLAALAKI